MYLSINVLVAIVCELWKATAAFIVHGFSPGIRVVASIDSPSDVCHTRIMDVVFMNSCCQCCDSHVIDILLLVLKSFFSYVANRSLPFVRSLKDWKLLPSPLLFPGTFSTSWKETCYLSICARHKMPLYVFYGTDGLEWPLKKGHVICEFPFTIMRHFT